MKKKILFTLIMFLFVFNVISKKEKVKDASEYSIDNLLNIQVTTATKSKVMISEAPAIISVLTAEQIENFGVRKLSDVLNYIPGFISIDSYWKPDINVVRGIRPTLYNDKVLMLINGVPAYDAASMEYFINTVPIDVVDRIEIIRGPGSTLYGTNAFAGVINIITKKEGKNHVRIAYGSFESKETGLFFNKTINGVNILFSASMRDDNGYEKNIYDETGIKNKNVYERDIHSFFGTIKYGEFSLDIGHSYQHFGKFGVTPRFAYGNNYNTESGKATHLKTYANLFFEHQFGKFETKFTLHFDSTDKQTAVGSFGDVFEQLNILPQNTAADVTFLRFGGTVLLGEFQGKYALKNATVTGGFSVENRKTKWLSSIYDNLNGNLLSVASTKDVPFNICDIGGYLQIDGKVMSKLGYILGIRFTKLGITNKWYTNPRGGLVYAFTHGNSFKILYGEAFRSPGPQEQYYSVAGLIYGPDFFGKQLEPERIRTIEVAIDTTIFERYKLLANVFSTKVFDIIGRRNSTPEEFEILKNTARVYGNLGNQDLKGLEIELKGFPKTYKISNFFLNISYKEGKEENGEPIPYLAKITGNAGISFDFFKRLRLSLFYQYIGNRYGVMTDGTQASVPSYNLINMSAGFKLDENFKIGMNIQNLTDVEYFYPEYVRKRIKTIPGGPSRSITLWLKYVL
jgi:iron complex outermembrane receptor protein